MKTIHLATLLACIFPLNVSAQTNQPVSELDNIVVTASRVAQLESEVVGDISVIDRATLEQAGQSSVAELLSREHGIQISTTGGPQTPTSVFMRGADSRHTLVLIDGVRVNSNISNAVNFNALNPAQIERIEILRGAGSSLYGSEAIGGVINIITKKGQTDTPLAFWGEMGLGTHSLFKSSVGFSGQSNGFSYNLIGSLANSDGFRSTNANSDVGASPRGADGYESNSIKADVGYAFSNKHRLDAHLFSSYINGEFTGKNYDFFPAITEQNTSATRQQAYGLRSTNKFFSNWTSQLSINETRETYQGYNGSNVETSSYRSTLRSYAWQNDITLGQHQTLTALLEHNDERGKRADFAHFSMKRHSNAGALIYSLNYGRHHAQASLRHDRIAGLTSRTTGAIAYDFDITTNWTVGASYNTGFKMPTLYENYNNQNIQQSLALPETSKNMEARIAYRHDTGSVKLVAYQNRINNLLAWQALSPTSMNGIYYNINKAKIKGYTLTFDQQLLDDLNIWGSVDLTNPRNRETDQRLTRRAAQVYRLGANYTNNNLQIGAEYSWTAQRSDTDFNTGNDVTLGGFSLVNLTAQYAFNKTLTASIRWDNVFNKRYEYIYGYNTPGSNVFVNLTWRM